MRHDLEVFRLGKTDRRRLRRAGIMSGRQMRMALKRAKRRAMHGSLTR